MARRPATTPLNVLLNGRRVGLLRREPDGAVTFRYEAEWLGWENAIPVSLSLPLREDRYAGDAVLAVFDNLLPDGRDIRMRLAERTAAAGSDAYGLLAAVGRDCVGALQFLPDDVAPEPPGRISATRLSPQDIAAMLANLALSPLGVDAAQDFRISLAGAQKKTALLRWQNAWHQPHGATPTTHILKPQIGRLANGIDLSQSVENEHFCLSLVEAFGLPVARSSIEEFAGRRVLIVERFDRLWTRTRRLLRIPQEDCCQALGVSPVRKYEAEGGPGIRAISDLLKGSDTPREDQRLFFKAQILFWLMAATDGHAKNFSLRLAPGGRFTLAPLYDVLSTQPLFDAGQIPRKSWKLSMALGRGRHYAMQAIQPRHFLQTAEACGVPESLIIELFAEFVAAAPQAIDRAIAEMPKPFPRRLVQSIVIGLKGRLALLQG